MGSINGFKGGSRSGGDAAGVRVGVGDWAADGTGSYQDNKAAMRPNVQTDRSIIQAPLRPEFRCAITESATFSRERSLALVQGKFQFRVSDTNRRSSRIASPTPIAARSRPESRSRPGHRCEGHRIATLHTSPTQSGTHDV